MRADNAVRAHVVVICLLGATSALAVRRSPLVPGRSALKPAALLLPVGAGKSRGCRGATMSAVSLADRVCPALGFLLSNALYAAPLPATLRRVKAGSLGELNPLPSALMVIGTTSWLGYALSAGNPWIAATNVPGALLAIGTFVALLPLMRPGRQLQQVQATVVGGSLCTISLWTYLIFSGASAATRSGALGTYASAICVLLFASPLSTISRVIRTGNAASILAPLTAAQCLNCLLWTTYGVFAARDVFVWGPNGTGLILGLAQLALKVCFRSWEDDAKE